MASQSLPGWIALQYRTLSSICAAIISGVMPLRLMLGIASKSEQSGIGGTSSNNPFISVLFFTLQLAIIPLFDLVRFPITNLAVLVNVHDDIISVTFFLW